MRLAQIATLFATILMMESPMTAQAQTSDIVGKTIVHSWAIGPFPADMPRPAFETLFCSADRLVWNNVTDPDAIIGQAENYSRVEIGEGIVQISWKESPETTNLGVVWTLNFNSGKIYGVIVNGNPKMNFVLEGEFTVRDGTSPAPGRSGC
jgi:hypothetical protein